MSEGIRHLLWPCPASIMRPEGDMLRIIKHASERKRVSRRVSDAISCGSFSQLEAVVWNSVWKLVGVTSETFRDNTGYIPYIIHIFLVFIVDLLCKYLI